VTATRARRIELAVLLALLVLAAVTRLPGLADRGRWDADQGTDMRVLRGLAIDGEVPLLGPRTSIGTFHHGAAYYYLLAPAAIASSADPVAVTAEIALFGIAAVAGTWWLARLVGGPLAGAAAGLLAAVSPAGIDESTFIWNPNLIPAAAALALAATIQARRTGRARWWGLAGLGAMVTMQCHVLGVVLVLPLAGAWVADRVARRRDGRPLAGLVRGGLSAALVIAAGYLPLLAHEVGHDFAETRAILAYVADGGREAAFGVADRIAMVGLRSVTWPVTGLLTDRLPVSMLAALVVILLAALAVTGRRRPAGAEPGAEPGADPGAAIPSPDAVATARWLLLALVISVVALALFAPSLAVIVPGLPNDHYHAFLDPVVLALVGAGLARLVALPIRDMVGRGEAAVAVPRGEATVASTPVAHVAPVAAVAAVAAVLVALVVVAVTAWPPPHAPDGGWPLADAAARRVAEVTAGEPFALDGIPPFKNDNALRFPLERRGAPVLASVGEDEPPPAGAGTIVLVCDPLFDEVVGAPCGGPAETAWLAGAGRDDLGLVGRFAAGSRRVVSIYSAGVP
jgi:4-amino-4-deoxy-L-arabinose transferase-like glycosyltransferase